ncbi:hypothetical protein CEXT_731341 [Caerostris extrusa]|uniref:Uncharacterized protein n=1 Tax=Caerostris extrusa TaxID=172846 RepID=A0AAV4X7P9_CAEEX|nr:hypothetical protein CEXT_731341 [Caerostris extrusa]
MSPKLLKPNSPCAQIAEVNLSMSPEVVFSLKPTCLCPQTALKPNSPCARLSLFTETNLSVSPNYVPKLLKSKILLVLLIFHK